MGLTSAAGRGRQGFSKEGEGEGIREGGGVKEGVGMFEM